MNLLLILLDFFQFGITVIDKSETTFSVFLSLVPVLVYVGIGLKKEAIIEHKYYEDWADRECKSHHRSLQKNKKDDWC